jgi:hypothetical protein
MKDDGVNRMEEFFKDPVLGGQQAKYFYCISVNLGRWEVNKLNCHFIFY